MVPPHAAAVRSVAAAGVWATVSAALVLTNKALLSGPFPFPLTLALLHSACAGLVFCVCSASGPAAVPLRAAAPVGGLFAASLALANAAFAAGVSVPGAQSIKAATSAAVYGLSIVAALDTLTRRRAAAVAAILAGVAVAATGETSAGESSVAASSTAGLALQAGAVCAEAGRLVLLQTLLAPRVTPVAVLARVAPVSAAALVLPWAALEARPLLSSFFSAAAAPPPPLLAASAAIAIALNLAAAHLVQTASALALTVTGVIKDWALVVASALLFQSRVAPATAAGYALACAGVAVYQRDAWLLAAAARDGRPPSAEKRELLPARRSKGGETA